MKKSNYKPKIPDLMEAVFDAVYLTFDLAAAVLFFFILKRKYPVCTIWNTDIDTLWRGCFSSGAKNYKGCTWNQ